MTHLVNDVEWSFALQLSLPTVLHPSSSKETVQKVNCLLPKEISSIKAEKKLANDYSRGLKFFLSHSPNDHRKSQWQFSAINILVCMQYAFLLHLLYNSTLSLFLSSPSFFLAYIYFSLFLVIY